MNYPFGVPGLLLPPPPPPSPPPPHSSESSVSSLDKHAPTKTPLDATNISATDVNASQIHEFNQYHQERSMPAHLQPTAVHLPSMIPSPGVDNIHLQSVNHASGGLMILPASHLGLPPPPPPPPLSSSPSEIAGARTHTDFRNRNFIPHGGQKSQQQGKYHSYRSAPPMWTTQKQFPSGLQGPWKTPDSAENLDQSGDTAALLAEESAIESAFPPDFGPEGIITTHQPDASKLTPALTTYKDHKVDPKDPRLPKELTNLFEALNCKLCEVVSSSTVQAKHHYSGKPHEKKVRHWLQKWSEETGQPAPKRQKVDHTVDIKPEDLYCKLCEVAFTSVKHGEQHRMGKPHQRALRQGYSTSKMKTKKLDIPIDPTGRFGIGEAFQKEVLNTNEGEIKSDSHLNNGVIPEISSPKSSITNDSLFCQLCEVAFTSVKHGEQHKMGKSHQRALRLGYSTSKMKNKKLDNPMDPTGRFGTGEAFQKEGLKTNEGEIKLDSHQNYSVIPETPSPKSSISNNRFFCQLCQISTTSQEHLDFHYAGAKHRKALVNAARLGIKQEIKPESSVIPPPVEPAESILASVIGHNDMTFSKKNKL